VSSSRPDGLTDASPPLRKPSEANEKTGKLLDTPNSNLCRSEDLGTRPISYPPELRKDLSCQANRRFDTIR